MAENEMDATETPTEPPAAKLSITQILMIVGLVVVAQGGVTLLMDELRSDDSPAEVSTDADALLADETGTEPEIDVQDLAPANYLPLDPALVVNLQHPDKSRFLQTTVQLMTRDDDVFDAARLHSPAIRSALIMLFGTVDYETVSTREGKERLQDQARSVADEVLMELAGRQGIDAVYLTSFVVQ